MGLAVVALVALDFLFHFAWFALPLYLVLRGPGYQVVDSWIDRP